MKYDRTINQATSIAIKLMVSLFNLVWFKFTIMVHFLLQSMLLIFSCIVSDADVWFSIFQSSIFSSAWKEATAFDNNRKLIPYYQAVQVSEPFLHPWLIILVQENERGSKGTFNPKQYHDMYLTELWVNGFHGFNSLKQFTP